jgi:soluble lytic murein transglycosylase-like protein
MRHEVFYLFVVFFALYSSAHCAPNEYSADLATDSSRNYILINSYFNTASLETTPVSSQYLDMYELQDSIQNSNENTDLSKNNLILDRKLALLEKSESANKSNPVFHGEVGERFSEIIFSVSQEYNIDPLLIYAIAEVESNFNAKAVSHAGAQGLMQIMPDTARRYSIDNQEYELFNPLDNLRISSNYLRSLHKIFGNNIPLILAAYNAGENAVIKYGYKIPPYKETTNYVEKVMKRYMELKDISYQL